MTTIVCDDCGATLTGEPYKGSYGPAALTVHFECECGSEWRALSDGTKWRPPPMVGGSTRGTR